MRNFDLELLEEVIGDYSMAGSRRNDAPGNIRSDRLVIGYRGSVFSDEKKSTDLRKVVRILVSKKDGKVLSIIDRNDSFSAGLPGGGVEPGESLEDAARRELWEETGLIPDEVVQIRTDVVGSNECTLFLAKNVEGRLRGSEEGEAAWLEKNDLLKGNFGRYYKMIFSDLDML